jgi:hypothetical protein
MEVRLLARSTIWHLSNSLLSKQLWSSTQSGIPGHHKGPTERRNNRWNGQGKHRIDRNRLSSVPRSPRVLPLVRSYTVTQAPSSLIALMYEHDYVFVREMAQSKCDGRPLPCAWPVVVSCFRTALILIVPQLRYPLHITHVSVSLFGLVGVVRR